jgi:effector protein SdbA
MSKHKKAYDNIKLTKEHISQPFKKPLMIGCSGGGGHISAILGIEQSLKQAFPATLELPLYAPVLAEQKPHAASIHTGANIMHAYGVGKPLQKIIELTPLPLLPNTHVLDEEIKNLSKKEQANGLRCYIDMLLDVYPEGYESAAIWNIFQRNDETSTLRKLIALQSMSDTFNYQIVYDYFMKKLQASEEMGAPYTEIISTQAMALPALCDVVSAYNARRSPKNHIVINQYLTDLPTLGAVHFFNVLATLTPTQQRQIRLYGVNMTDEVIQHFFPSGNQFNKIYNVPANKNPMVRVAFKDRAYDNSDKFHEQVTLSFQKEAAPYTIASGEQIASIMLGSQASADTVKYIEPLLKCGIERVFVFGGKNKSISDKIDELINKHPEYKDRIIRLDNQSDKKISALMTRSNIVVTRGGGLSVMEQMAMSHNPEQTILIHHADANENAPLSSGISWEDSNVDKLIENLQKNSIYAQKTSPSLALRHIAEGQIINCIKRNQEQVELKDLVQKVRSISKSTSNQCLAWLNEGHEDKVINYFNCYTNKENQHEKKYLSMIESLNTRCDDCIDYLSKQILDEMKNQNECYIQLLEIDTEESVVAVESLDATTIVAQILNNELRNPSPALLAAAKSYDAVRTLQSTISCTNEDQSPFEKLNAFKNSYRDKEIKHTIQSNQSNVFKRLIDEIIYQFAIVFSSKKAETLFNPTMVLRKEIHHLKDETSIEPFDGGPTLVT